MSKLQLSVAMGDYDRTRALLDGRVLIDGVDPVYMTLSPEETFFKAFSQAKDAALELLSDTSATKVTLPFVEEPLKAARETLGQDFWSCGVARNSATLETFARHHHAQRLSSRPVPVEQMFHPVTYETYAI
jgi:hypothetical protein